MMQSSSSRQQISSRSEVEGDEQSHQQQFISQFFQDGEIGAKIGSLFETTVSSTLIRSGFKPWPLQDLVGSLSVNIGGQKKRFQIPGFDSARVNSRRQGEIDCVVSGDSVAWERLCTLCPFSKTRFTFNTSPALFLVEVKASSTEFIEKIKKKKTSSMKSANENEGYVADEDYWLLLDSSTSFEHKILFVNGGEESKNWVMNGGSSTKESERVAWIALEAQNVSLFYCESFSQEWVSDVSGNLVVLKAQNQEIMAQYDETKAALHALQESVQSLLAERKK